MTLEKRVCNLLVVLPKRNMKDLPLRFRVLHALAPGVSYQDRDENLRIRYQGRMGYQMYKYCQNQGYLMNHLEP